MNRACKILKLKNCITRPFYFLVHPDLFGKHPEAQEQNEKSLKTLKNYVDFLTERKIPNPKDVTFFIKPRTQEEKVFFSNNFPAYKEKDNWFNLKEETRSPLKGGKRGRLSPRKIGGT